MCCTAAIGAHLRRPGRGAEATGTGGRTRPAGPPRPPPAPEQPCSLMAPWPPRPWGRQTSQTAQSSAKQRERLRGRSLTLVLRFCRSTSCRRRFAQLASAISAYYFKRQRPYMQRPHRGGGAHPAPPSPIAAASASSGAGNNAPSPATAQCAPVVVRHWEEVPPRVLVNRRVF